MLTQLKDKHHLTVKVLPIAALAVILKYILITVDWQPLPASALLGSMLSADVFLLGFLISGSLPDYKEAEKLPSEIAASLDALVDETLVLLMNEPKEAAGRRSLERLLSLTQNLKAWFHKKISTGEAMVELRGLNQTFAEFEPLTQANFIVRMKQEQQQLRRFILRVRTIREVTFVTTAYAIGEIFTFFVVSALVLSEVGALVPSLFFTFVFTFLVVYMIALVKDLDNPFHYHGRKHTDEVDTAPLDAVEHKLQRILDEG